MIQLQFAEYIELCVTVLMLSLLAGFGLGELAARLEKSKHFGRKK